VLDNIGYTYPFQSFKYDYTILANPTTGAVYHKGEEKFIETKGSGAT